MDYLDLLHSEFSKETDRAAVIVSASLIDELLRGLLIARLVPVSSSSDDLFDGANASLGTLSSRIEMAYRLGLISVKLARDLHLVRKIRNDFAHNVHGSSFEDTRVKSRITELDNSHGIFLRSAKASESLSTTRAHFLEAVSWMIFHLEKLTQSTQAMDGCLNEWGYAYLADPRFEGKDKEEKQLEFISLEET